MGFYQGNKVRIQGGSSRGFLGSLGSRSERAGGAPSPSRWRNPGDVYGSTSRSYAVRVPSQGRDQGPGLLASLRGWMKKDGADAAPARRTESRVRRTLVVDAPRYRVDVPPSRPTPPPSGEFYRPPSADRGRWADASTGKAKIGGWVPKAILSPRAKKWALKAAMLAVLAAVSVVMQGRVVEALQDLAGFHLAEVKVTGTHYLSEAEVREASGLKAGDGMFHLDLKNASGRVSALPWVKRVFFERRLPQNILINVEERKPAALVDAGSLWGVDEEGRMLPPSQELLNEDLPLLSGVAVRPQDAGNTRNAEVFRPALGFLAFLKKEDPSLYADVSEVQIARADDLRVTFLDGTVARFCADAGESELRHMAAVLSDLAAKNRRAALMDFRYKDQVVVRLRQ